MEAHVKRSTDKQQVQVLDEQGRVIGVISRPISPDVLGPGREKVYLARPRRSDQRASHAA